MLNSAIADTTFPNSVTAARAVEHALDVFTPISLADIGKAELLNRVETKYVVSAEVLPTFLSAMRPNYSVLSIEGQRLNRYKTLYFDSADFSLYRRHHAGASNRYKVRSRQYVESGTNFLEVKHKDNKRQTRKQRCATDDFLSVIDRPSHAFLSPRYPHNVDLLFGRLLTNYSRITLVSRHDAERVTIDLDLSFEWEERNQALENVAIVEIKRAPHSAESRATQQLRQQQVRPQRFSKYCIGVSLVYPQVKHNNFKPTLRRLNALSQGSSHAN